MSTTVADDRVTQEQLESAGGDECSPIDALKIGPTPHFEDHFGICIRGMLTHDEIEARVEVIGTRR